MKINTGIVPSSSQQHIPRERSSTQAREDAPFRIENQQQALKRPSKAINAYVDEDRHFPQSHDIERERVVKGPFLEKPQHRQAIDSYLQNENIMWLGQKQKSQFSLYL